MPVSGPAQQFLFAVSAEGSSLARDLEAFREFGESTRKISIPWTRPGGQREETTAYVNEFWTSKQRAASRLHEVSYRACFKPQLPRFFIERLTRPGDVVYDPFMGRGTSLVEAALLGRIPFGCDVNPLSSVLTVPRLAPPTLEEIGARLQSIDFTRSREFPEELLTFYHPATLRHIVALKEYFLGLKKLDSADQWIRMVAINRLTGHSPGFFSVYTLPPNQAVSLKAQQKINQDRKQTPPERNVAAIILKKSRSLLSDLDSDSRSRLCQAGRRSLILTQACASTPQIPSDSVALAVTSPPFLDVVDYAGDNWLRCWFLGLDAKNVPVTMARKLEQWSDAMTGALRELRRVLKPGGHVAFEVGEVHGGKTKLEETILPAGLAAGLTPELVLINDQEFTKTANCWGVANNAKGTNTNRVVVFRK